MSIFTPHYLASGQLASSKGTIYTVPTGMRAIIDSIVYYNTTGGALVCNSYINDGTSRQFHKVSVPTVSRSIVLDNNSPLYLDEADLIEGDTSSATSVNYFIFGRLQAKR